MTKKILNCLAGLIYVLSNVFLSLLELILFGIKGKALPKTILLWRTGSLGDTLCAIPAMRLLRDNFKGAKIILMTAVSPYNQPQDILSGLGLYDEVLVYESSDLKSKDGISRLFKKVKKLKVDLLIYLNQAEAPFARLVRDMLFFRLANCRAVRGFRISKHRYFRISQRYLRSFDNEVERLVKIIPSVNNDRSKISSLLSVDSDISRKSLSLVSPLLNSEGSILIALSPGSNFPVKHWEEDSFIKLSDILQKEFNAGIVILGDKKDVPVCKAIFEALKDHCLDLSGKTTIREAAEILRRCELLVSCDCGLVHLAAAVNTPVVGIYTARDYPNCWYPFGDGHIVIRHDVPCQVCFKHKCKSRECIKGIEVDEVFDACRKALSIKSRKARV